MKIIPLEDKVLIRRQMSDRTEGGLLVPAAAQERRAKFFIEDFGPKCEGLVKGAEVVLDPNTKAVQLNGDENRAVIPAYGIWAILSEDN